MANNKTRESVLETLKVLREIGPCVSRVIADKRGVTVTLVNRHMQALHAESAIHIHATVKGKCQRIWKAGPGKDAEIPVRVVNVLARPDMGPATPGLEIPTYSKTTFVDGRNPWTGEKMKK